MHTQDEELVARLALNLDTYYEQLVSLYWQQLRNFVFRQTGSVQDAEDIVQEAIVRAYLALERYSPQRIQHLKIRPWLYKLTWNVYCNYMNRSKPAQLVPLDMSEDGLFLEREDDRHEQPEVVFENAERRRELETLVCVLPPRYREIVNMYYFEELSHREIAEILNVPTTTIRVYLHRGIQMLRKTVAVQKSEVSWNDAV
jgi:RNA polymerase sigma-70 factor (ECF subfamily)